MGKKAISFVIAGILSLGMVMTSAFAAEATNTEADWIAANNAVSAFVETNDTAFDAELAAEKLSLGNALDIGDNVRYENESNNYYYQANILYDDYTVHAYVGGYDLDWYVFDLSSAATVRITAVCKYSGLQFGFFDRYGDDCLASTKVSYQGDGYYGANLSYNLPAGRYTLLFLSGNRTNMSYTFYASIPTKLAAPTISATTNADTGKPVISWSAVSGASKYKVYGSTTQNGSYSLIDTVNSTSYTHTAAKVGSAYYYKVCAVSGSTTGSASAAKGVYCDLPRPTISVTTNATSGKPVISWTAVEGATGYTVSRSSTKNGEYTKLTTTTADKLNVTHTGAEVGQAYYYKVRAVYGDNTSCNSAYSDAAGVYCDLKAPTIKVTNRASDGKPTISWGKVDGATSYIVYRCDTKDGEYVKLTSTTKLSITHTGAVAGEDYYYKVKAVYGSNTSCNSAMSAAKGVWCDLKQPTMTATTNTATGKPVLSWTAVDGATGYEVYRCGTKNGEYVKLTTTVADKLSITHTGATAGEDYYYKVRAVYGDNSSCNSAFSEIKGVWCDLNQPTIQVSNRASDGKPTISWSKVDGATSYEVYRCGSKNGEYVKLTSTTKLSITHTGAQAGEDYYYKVRAIYGDNSSCNSAFSAIKGIWCDLKAPVVTLTNRVSDGKPTISWTKVDGATGYEVYHLDCETGEYNKIYTATATKLNVTHIGVAAGEKCTYKVCAIYESNPKCNSAMSTEESIYCALSRPTLTAELNSKGKPYITWTAVEGATSYVVYYSVDGTNYKQLFEDTTCRMYCTHSGAKAGNEYSYKVIAIYDANTDCNSAYSAVTTINAQ